MNSLLKGSLFVWGSGNGWVQGDNCGADGYANSMFTITFAAADYNGRRAQYCGKSTYQYMLFPPIH